MTEKSQESENLKPPPLPPMQWTKKHEDILVDWTDKAMCYRWMHTKAAGEYSMMSKAFTIPVIIMSTLTGTANFAIDRIPESYQANVQIGIGAINILAGIITTVQQFLKVNELCESHRVASLSWDKFYRNIRMELTKAPKERTEVRFLLKSSKLEYDRLMETSPAISRKIAKKFINTFKNKKSVAAEWKLISKPDVCDVLESARSILYTEDDKELEKEETKTIANLIKQKQTTMEVEGTIDSFMTRFQQEYSRTPTVSEVYENLKDTVQRKVIDNWLNRKHKTSVETKPPIVLSRGETSRF